MRVGGDHARGTPHGPHCISPRRSEQRDHGRAHGRRDVHRRRVHADERARAARSPRRARGSVSCAASGRRSARAWRAGRCGKDRGDQRALALVGRAGDHDGEAVLDDAVEQRRRARGRPALEQPARTRMHMNEAALRPARAARAARRRAPAPRRRAPAPGACRRRRDRCRCAAARRDWLRPCGARAASRLAIEMRELPPPHAGARVARSRVTDQRGRSRRASCSPRECSVKWTRRSKRRARSRRSSRHSSVSWVDDAALFPAAVDGVHLRDGRVPGQHRLGVAVDQRVDFRCGHGARKGGEHRRSQQHVAMMAQLGHEHAMNFVQGNGVRERARHGGQRYQNPRARA